MSEPIIIPCHDCDGKGGRWHYYWTRHAMPATPSEDFDPGLQEYVKCETCNGFKKLIATELHQITKAVPYE